MPNPFEKFGYAEETASPQETENPFAKFGFADDEQSAKPPERTLAGTLGDIGVTAAKGAVGLVQSGVGLYDMTTPQEVGKTLEHIGIDLKGARDYWDDKYSDAQKYHNAQVHNAEGFTGTLEALKDNPSVVGTTVLESLPQMAGGGAIARGLNAGRAVVAPYVAGAVGEGAMAGGNAAEQIRGQTETGVNSPLQQAAAVATGAVTGGVGAVGGKVASRFGGDIDTVFAGGIDSVKKWILPKIIASGATEGAEELAQSTAEKAIENYALGRPLDEGVPEAGAIGLAAGVATGAPVAAYNSLKAGQQQRLNEQSQPSQAEMEYSDEPSRPPEQQPADLQNSSIYGDDPIAQQQAPQTQELHKSAEEIEGDLLAPDDIDTQIAALMGDFELLRNRRGLPAPGDVQTPDSVLSVTPGGVAAPQYAAEQIMRNDREAIGETPAAASLHPGYPGELQANPLDRLTARGEPTSQAINPDELKQVRQDAAAERAKNMRLSGVLPEGFDDERLAREEYRNILEGLGNQLTPGGDISYTRDGQDRITGRTSSVNPDWFKNLPPEEKLSVSDTQEAIKKALAGEKLGVRQTRMVKRVLDEAGGVRSNQAEHLKAQRKEVQRARKEALKSFWDDMPDTGNDPFGIHQENVAELFNEDNYEPEATYDDRSIAEMASQAEAMGADWRDVDKALDSGDSAQTIQALSQLIYGLRNEHRPTRTAPNSAAPGAAQAGDIQPGHSTAPVESMAGESADVAQPAEAGRAGEVAPTVKESLTAVANEAATSPSNDLPEPTEAQKEAGNYKKGHVRLHGLDIAIENPKGSMRRGTDKDGKAWESEMQAHYGYVKRTTGADGDQVDVFIGEKPESDKVFVIDQYHPDGTFDEHKAVMGASSMLEAKSLYKRNYQKGWKVGPTTAMSVDEFKAWLKDGDTTKPLSAPGNLPVKPREESSISIPPRANNDAASSDNLVRGEKSASKEQRNDPAAGAQSKEGNNEKNLPPADANAEKPIGKIDKIEDVGDQLTWNKKGLFKSGGLLWGQIKGENATLKVKMAVKQKVWAKPDWETMVESVPAASREGFAVVAHLIKQVYDSIPAKPKGSSDDQLEAYIQAVGDVRKASEELLNNKENQARLWAALAASAAGRSKALGGSSIIDSMRSSGSHEHALNQIIDQVFPKINGVRWAKGSPEMLRAQMLGKKSLQAMQINSIDAIKAIKAIEGGWPKSQEAWQRQGFSVVEQSDDFPIAPSVYDNYASVTLKAAKGTGRDYLGKYPSEQEAMAAAEARAKELSGKFVLFKKGNRVLSVHDTELEATEAARAQTSRKPPSSAEEQPKTNDWWSRLGPEHRAGGKDISADDLKNDFNFRGVNFGKWVNQKERQQHINAAYDALHDLAAVLNVPPEALGLGGKLGLAIGAQGAGGNAAAHFVPGVNEINITKTVGAGSLAHEWAHALDHHFGVMAGLDRSDMPYASHLSGYQVERISSDDSGIRPELARAIHNVLALSKSKTETPEDALAANEKNLENAKATLERYIKSFQIREKISGSETATNALQKIERGDVGEYVNLPVDKGKRKSVGAIPENIKTVFDAMGLSSKESYEKARFLFGVSLYANKSDSDLNLKSIHTDFYKRSRGRESKSGKPYWATPHELFARAFESWVMDRLATSGGKNHYLVHDSKTDRAEPEDDFAYPAGSEREVINGAFDKLIAEIKVQDSDSGKTLYSLSDLPDIYAPISQGEMAEVINRVQSSFGAKLKITAVASAVELPPEVQAHMEKNGIAGNKVKGVFHGGSIFVNREALQTEQDVERVILHELAHVGLAKMFGQDIQAAMGKLYFAIGGDKALRELATKYAMPLEKYQAAYASAKPAERLGFMTEELLAHIAENNKPSVKRFLKELIGAIRSWLRSKGFLSSSEMSESELFALLKEVRQFAAVDDGGIRYSLSDGPRPSGGFSLSGKTEERKVYGIPLDTIIRKLQDKMRPLLTTQRAIKNSGRSIAENEDAYLAEELFHGKTENDLRKMKERFIEPLTKKMAESKIEREELDLYLWARHAEERNIQIAKINPEMPDGGSGMTTAQAKEVLRKFAAEGRAAALNDAAKVVYAMLAEKRLIVRHGLADDVTVDTWENIYQSYVPLKGYAKNEGGTRSRAGRGFDIRGNESMRALGRRTMPESPILHSLRDLTESIIRFRKNEVGNAFLNLIQANPDPDYWQVFDSTDPEFERKLLKSEGREVVGNARVTDKSRYFITKKNGKEYWIKLEDPLLLRAMQNLGPEKLNGFFKVMAKATRFLSSMVTQYNPEFIITNFERDIQAAIINLQAEIDLHDGKVRGKQITGAMIRGVMPAMKAAHAGLRGKPYTEGPMQEWSKAFDDFRNAGGATGWYQVKDVDELADELSGLVNMQKKTFIGAAARTKQVVSDFVSNANGAVENATRLAVYKAAVDAGVSRQKAASLAKNLTVNFNRKGEVGTAINSLYMFFNASVQGTASLARALGTMKIGADGNRHLNMSQKIVIGLMGASFALALLNRGMGGDDDDGESWWDKVPDAVKDRNLVIMKSVFGLEQNGEYFKIPLPYGYNVFHAIATNVESVTRGSKGIGKGAGAILKSMLGAFSPIGVAESDSFSGLAARTITPTVFKPFTDLTANENFFGGKIYAENMPFDTPKPDSQLSMRATAEPWKWIAKFMNQATGGSDFRSGIIDVSPDKMGYIFNYFTGGAGQFVSSVLDTGIKTYQGREIGATETPFARKLVGKVTPYKDQNLFYERKKEIDQIHDELKSMPAGSAERREFAAEHKKSLNLVMAAKVTAKDLSNLRKKRNAIMDNDDLSEKEKDERLKPIEAKMKAKTDSFNKRYNG